MTFSPPVSMSQPRRVRHAALPAVLSIVLTIIGPMPASAEPSPLGAPVISALVHEAPLRQGSLAQTETALGQVITATDKSLAVAFQRNVQVLQVRVRAGETVRRGQALITVQGAPGSNLAYVQATTGVRFATSDLKRIEQLAGQQLATQAQVNAARKTLADAQAQLAAARAQGLGGGVQTITAPFDGIVLAVHASPGAQIGAGSDALMLAPAGGLQAVVGVTPDVASALHAGQAVRVSAVFDGDHSTSATVLAIGGVVDAQSHLVNVTLALPAQASGWMPGLAVQASMQLHPWRGWVVPRQAVLRDASGQAYVFQDDRGKARRVNVTVEIDQAEHTGIAGDLLANRPLVVLGNYEISNGMALRVAK